jgi:CRP-like cAMP-binding protein
MSFLHRSASLDLPFFQRWSHREVARFTRIAERVEYEPGESLVYEGSYAKEFLLLIAGRADVVSRGRRLGELGRGDFVGHDVLLDGGPAERTVQATQYCDAWLLAPAEFISVHAHQRTFRASLEPQVAEDSAPECLRGNVHLVQPAPIT